MRSRIQFALLGLRLSLLQNHSMRIASIAPQEHLSSYEHAVARSNGEFTLPHFVSDLESTDGIDELLAKHSEFDAVTMLSPNSISQTQIDQLVNSGKHVLGNAHHTTPDFLAGLNSKWNAANLTYAVAQPRRFTDYAFAIKDGLQHKQLGDAGLLRIHHWMEPSDKRDLPQPALWQATVNEVDLACGFFRDAPDMVFAQNMPTTTDGTPSGILIHLGFPSGGMSLIDVAYHRGKPFYSVTLVGSRGAAYADDHHNTNLLLKEETRGIAVADNTSQNAWLCRQIESFVHSIRNKEQSQSVSEMTLAIRIGRAALQSIGANQTVKRIGDRYELQ